MLFVSTQFCKTVVEMFLFAIKRSFFQESKLASSWFKPVEFDPVFEFGEPREKNGGLNAQRARNPKETKQGSACSRTASCSKAQIYCNKQTVSLQAGLLSLEKLFLEFPEDLQLGIY